MSEQQSSQQQNRSQLLVIDREKWLRGEGAFESFLLRPTDGKMCCVGFYCLSLGRSSEEIEGVKWPHTSWTDLPGWLWRYTEAIESVAWVNDAIGEFVLDARREAQLAKLFLEQGGITLEFIN